MVQLKILHTSKWTTDKHKEVIMTTPLSGFQTFSLVLVRRMPCSVYTVVTITNKQYPI
jgi:hypothetical protein